MSNSTYPVTLDTFTDPTTGDTLDNVGSGTTTHHGLHGKANDAAAALEALVGTNASQTTPTGTNRVLASTSASASTWTATPTVTSLNATSSLSVAGINVAGVISAQTLLSDGNFAAVTIPAGFNGFRIHIFGRTTDAANQALMGLRFNGDSGANYDDLYMVTGSATAGNHNGATSAVCGALAGNNATASWSGALTIDVPAYAGTTFFKQFTFGGGNNMSQGQAGEGQWRNTAAITSVTVVDQAGGTPKAGSVLVVEMY